MDHHQTSFAVGQFFCRFLPNQPKDDTLLIHEPYWEEDDPPLRYRNIADSICDTIKHQIDLGGAPFASWLLARLWYLSGGAVGDCLNVDAQGIGVADGGDYVLFAVIEDAFNQGVATLYVEGMDISTYMILTARSVNINPTEVIEALQQIIQVHPGQIAICRIAIADPENQGAIHEYGWDGEKFLGADRF